MASDQPGEDWQFGLVARLAQVLAAGRSPAETLRALTEVLRENLYARSVTLWHRAPNATDIVASRTPALATPGPQVAAFGDLVPPPSGVERVPLTRGVGAGGAPVGMLDLDRPGRPIEAVMRVIPFLLAPFLDGLELSEDLATEVARRGREAEEQRRFTSLIIDSLPVGLYVVDRQYRIQVWNRRREMGAQGLPRQDAVGRAVFEVLNRQPQDVMREEFDRVFATGEMVQAEITVRAGDPPRVYRISKIPMWLSGTEVTHVITVGEDITDARAADRRIQQSEKLAAMGQLAAGVMHEINNPLATIGACVAAIEGRLPGSDAGVREYLDIVDHEVQRCSHIVGRLLDFARPKGGTEPRVANLMELVEQTLFLLKHHATFGRLTVQREYAPDLPPVRVDTEQMIQVFMALLLNAADAMDGQGLVVVRSRAGRRGDEAIIEIEDEGPGIAPADLERIFEPFYTTKPPGRGTGLGLSICYGIIERHRGHITVESPEGRGTIVRVILPVAPEGAAA